MKCKQQRVVLYHLQGINCEIPRIIKLWNGIKNINSDSIKYEISLKNNIKEYLYNYCFERSIASALMFGTLGKPVDVREKIIKDIAKKNLEGYLKKHEKNDVFLICKLSRHINVDVNEKNRVVDKGIFYIGIDSTSINKKAFTELTDGIICNVITQTFVAHFQIDGSFCPKEIVDFVYYENESKKLLYNFSLEASGSLRITKLFKLPDLKRIGKNLRATKIFSDSKPLKLFKMMIDEDDKLKKFLYGYYCLEVAINKIFKKYRKTYNVGQYIKSNKSIMSDFIDLENKYKNDSTNVRDKFLLNSLFFWKNINSNDYKDFLKLKKLRNDMSHGTVPEEKEIPVNILECLVAKIIKESII